MWPLRRAAGSDYLQVALGQHASNTLDGRPNNLPQQATEFLGRGDELTAIHLMLESPTTLLLTITGPGGAGKTRLGLQVRAALENLVGCPPGKTPSPRQVGNKLRHFRRRVVGDLYLDSNPNEHHRNGAVWRLHSTAVETFV